METMKRGEESKTKCSFHSKVIYWLKIPLKTFEKMPNWYKRERLWFILPLRDTQDIRRSRTSERRRCGDDRADTDRVRIWHLAPKCRDGLDDRSDDCCSRIHVFAIESLIFGKFDKILATMVFTRWCGILVSRSSVYLMKWGHFTFLQVASLRGSLL